MQKSVTLIAAGMVMGIWVLMPEHLIRHFRAFPNTPTVTLVFLAAVVFSRPTLQRYKWSVVTGLAFSALGDWFLLPSTDQFVAGLASFLLAHVCYLLAFTTDTQFATNKALFVTWGAAGAFMLVALWAGLPGGLKVPVVVYSVALVSMAAQAGARALYTKRGSAWVASVGATLFVISDFLLAWQRFRGKFEGGPTLVLATYFVAQAGIAGSVLLSARCVECSRGG